MIKNFFAMRPQYLAFAAAGALAIGLTAAPARADDQSGQAYGTTQYNDEIVVTAPYTVQRHVDGRTAAGIPTETLSVARHVFYGDLNLARAADAQEFQNRIVEAAKDACGQLDRLYPAALYTPIPSDQRCEATAEHDAMAQYNTVMASASTSSTVTTTTVYDSASADVAAAQRAARRAARSAAEAQESAKEAQHAVEMASLNQSRMSGSSQRNK